MEEKPSQNNEDTNFGMAFLAEAFSSIPEVIEEKIAPVKSEIKELGTKIDSIKLKHGRDGKDGKMGKDGKNGTDGKDGLDGVDGKDGQDGLDGSPDSPKDVAKKLNTLEDIIDWKVLKDFKSLVNQNTLTTAIQTLENQTRYLIQKAATQSSSSLTSVTTPITLTGASVGIVNQGTATQVLHGNAAGNASFGAVSLTADVSGILPAANGGADAWVDYSATSTIVGWSSFTTKVILYQKTYGKVFIIFDLAGTSDSTVASFTVPFTSAPSITTWGYETLVVNNGTTATSPGRANVTSGSGTIDMRINTAGNTWTNTGTKRAAGKFWFEI